MDKQKILIVDDESATRTIVRIALGDESYSFREAENGEEALAALREEKPDLMVCDYEMPVMDGFELIRQVRGEAVLRELPIVMLTAFDSYSDAMTGIEAGADDYVVKPFNPDDLLSRVQLQLQREDRDASVEFPQADTITD